LSELLGMVFTHIYKTTRSRIKQRDFRIKTRLTRKFHAKKTNTKKNCQHPESVKVHTLSTALLIFVIIFYCTYIIILRSSSLSLYSQYSMKLIDIFLQTMFGSLPVFCTLATIRVEGKTLSSFSWFQYTLKHYEHDLWWATIVVDVIKWIFDYLDLKDQWTKTTEPFVRMKKWLT
jgi:hypothetical protein